MRAGTLILEPGTLWEKITRQTKHALQCGELQTIATEYEFVEQDGVNFLVRILANLERKAEDWQQQTQQFNPFLPYEEDLFVAYISDTHLCLLNKFNVVPYHLLIVTRLFEEQESWLTLQDFEAMEACLSQIDGLAFYNAGKKAGASQRHKHLQLVPLPLIPGGLQMPIEPAIASARFHGTVGRVPSLPFIHGIIHLDSSGASPLEAAQTLLEAYHTLLRAIKLQDETKVMGNRQSGAYNLLVTRRWMLIVPRSQESFQSIAVNSLGFAGTLFVRNPEQMKLLKNYGPLTILKKVAQS
ncbi:MAG: ATP adenylyltransferase family protein [Microcystaceae cyanobacterium]